MSDRDRPFDFTKFLADATEQMDMTGNLYVATDGETPQVVKVAAYVPVSLELAMDAGLITEEEARARGWEPTVYPPIPWWRRLRWRITAWRMKLGVRVGSWIAGERLYSTDEVEDYLE